MKANLSILALALSALLLTGCGTPRSTRAVTQSMTHIAVSIALQENPEIRPYLTAVTPVICAAGTGTNATPELVVAQIATMPSKNVTAAVVVNAVLAIWFSYADGPNSQAALQGVCTGLNFALNYGEPTNALGSPKAYPRVKTKTK